MPETRYAFLLVRRDADLARASDDMAAYLSFLRQRSPGAELEATQGIWVDEKDVANLPCELVLPNPAGTQRTVRILEATGINGIWMLCWLQAPASSVSRVDLVAALLECFGHGLGATPTARFIPVFSTDTPASSVRTEMQTIESRYPGLARPPIYQDSDGNLLLPTVQPDNEGTPS